MAPLLAVAGNVPLKGLRVQRRVTGPVVLAVHDVVADLHVVQNLGVGQGQHAGNPAQGAHAKVQQRAATNFAGAADADHVADVVHIGLAQVVHHAVADGVDFAFEFSDLFAAQVGRGCGKAHGVSCVTGVGLASDSKIERHIRARRGDAQANQFVGKDTVRFDVPHIYKQYVAASVKSTDGSGLNWTHYRYGEILLNLTEVNWALKQLGQSVSDNDIVKGINEIRTRAKLAPLSAGSLTLKDILAERAYELIFENKMLWDQRRTRKCVVYGIGEISAIQNYIGHQPAIFNYAFAPMHLLSPIPGNEIARNGLATQNSGYLPKQK